MNNLRQAAQQALEALESFQQSIGIFRGEFEEEVAALRAALAEPEPVIDKTMAKRIATQLGWEPAKKPLTDEEIAIISVACAATHRHDDWSFTRAIERAHGIRDSNGS